MSKYYLKPTIKAEPLIWRWYAWPYLIPPATAACNIVERHLKIMYSYVQNPQMHAQAVQNPEMLGGPFLDLDGKFTDEVKGLISYTQDKCIKLIELHNAIKDADRMLQKDAKGGTLEEMYQRLPAQLRGYTELVYDLNSHASLCLIEPFLYKNYYNDSEQELVLSNTTNDYRKFVLSTPRLDKEDEIYLKMPFSDKRLDFLFQLTRNPCDLKDIIELFSIPESKQPLFKTFFSEIPPILKSDNHYYGTGIRIRYFGHACLLLETKSVSILIDPVIGYPIQSEISRYSFDDLPDVIDYVVLTHNHQDHIMFETLLKLRFKIRNIVLPLNQNGMLADPSLRLIFEHIGFSSTIELNCCQSIFIDGGSIIALPFLGEHSDLNIHSKLSYCIILNDKKFMVAADSNNLDECIYDNIFNLTGSIDMLFVGMECDGAPLSWLYGPLLTSAITRGFDNSRTLSGSNFEKAWSMVKKLKCQHAYVYAMGQEPWLHHVMALHYSPQSIQILESDKFVAACKLNGIYSERLFGKKEWIIN